MKALWGDVVILVCLDYGGDRPQLLVTGGLCIDDNEYTILNDICIMDVQSGRWEKVSLN